MKIGKKIIESKEKIEKEYSNFYDPYCYAVFRHLIPEWVLPNHLTLIRLLGVPFFVYYLWNGHYLVSLILFVLLALTDMLDGTMARRRNQITELGTLLDPIADKILVASAIIVLLIKVNFTLAIVIIGLDLLVMLIAVISKLAGMKLSFKANLWGKIKLNLQVLGVGLIFLGLLLNAPILLMVAQIVLWTSVGFAVFSAINGGA